MLDPRAVVHQMMAQDRFSQWLGIEVGDVQKGSCTLSMVVREEMANGFAIAHGAIAFALADSAMAFASNTRGSVSVALTNTISYPAQISVGDCLVAEAREVSVTRRTAIYDVDVSVEGKVVAVFRGTVYRTGREHAIVSE